MSIFRRRQNASTEPSGTTPDTEAEQQDQAPDDAPAPARDGGPHDVADVEGRDGRVDLGALWVTPVAGMELRLEVQQSTQQVTAVTMIIGDSALQVQPFAAPRSSGLWEGIREEISASVEKQGGTVEEADGRFGPELRTRMPSAGPDGRTVFAPAVFVGVDGPRWFLRAVLSGRGAIDADAAAPLLDVLARTVVVRGVEPMAPRELLPLQLPQDARAAEGSGPGGDDAEGDDAGERRDDLDPFERGPEITEVR